MRIGIDVGGTNTDAVILDGSKVLAAAKHPTTSDVESGIGSALSSVLQRAAVGVGDIDAVMIGTTQFTNAFVQASNLARVGALRVGAPATRGIPPFSTWPERLSAAVRGGVALVAGGYQFDGRPISQLDERGVAAAAVAFRSSGVSEVAITGVFSQLNNQQEMRAAEIVREELPGASVTLSSELGRTGLLERENAAIMNASLRPLARIVAQAFQGSLRAIGLSVPFFVSQNDGTVMSSDHMRRFPVLTFAAGPTNSLRGAALLTGTRDALVADIGGTTADIGMLVAGFPRQSSLHVDIGGVRTNFRMPDVLSLGLGGGSRVRCGGPEITVGPDSVGHRLSSEALVFGGNTFTATDVAVAAGQAKLGDPNRIAGLNREQCREALDVIHRLLEDGIDRMKTSAQPLPLVLVGGGSILISRPLGGVSHSLVPEHADVANAVGAAVGQVGGEVDRIYNFADFGREAALDDAANRARALAVAAGASSSSLEIVDLEDIPLQYLPGGASRVVCRAVGDLDPVREVAHA